MAQALGYLPAFSEIYTRAHTRTHSHTSMGQLCVHDQQGSTSGFNTPAYKPFGYINTLICTFTDGNTVFMNCCCSDACFLWLKIVLVLTLQWHLKCLGAKCEGSQ